MQISPEVEFDGVDVDLQLQNKIIKIKNINLLFILK